MKKPKTLATMLRLTLLSATLLLSSCATTAPLPTRAEDLTAPLIARPDFQRAAQAAPEWVREALHTITRLETEKANHP